MTKRILPVVAIVCLLTAVQALVCEADVRARIEAPTPIPNNDRVVFAVVIMDNSRLCFVDLESGEVDSVLVPGKIVETWYGISVDPLGRFLATTVVGKDNNFNIWKMDVESREWSKIAEFPTDILQYPQVSPDGKTVLFRGAIAMDLWTLDVAAGKEKRLTNYGDIYRTDYAWASDGRAIYFSRGYAPGGKGLWRTFINTVINGSKGLWLTDINGSEARLISGKYRPQSMAVSKSGKYLAFWQDPVMFVSPLDSFSPSIIGRDCNRYFSWNLWSDQLVFVEGESLNLWEPGPDSDGKGRTITVAK